MPAFGGYGGLGGYSPYGGFGYGGLGGGGMPFMHAGGNGGFGGVGGVGGGLTQQMEAGLRPAFESLHAVVSTVSSVAVMLESCYFALSQSVRAVAALGDQFGRAGGQLRAMLGAGVRRLWRLVRLALYLAGLVESRPSPLPAATATATAATPGKAGGGNGRTLLFLAAALAGPLLLLRLASSASASVASTADAEAATATVWSRGEGEHYKARALYSYNRAAADELTVQAGEPLVVAPKRLQPDVPNWLLAASPASGSSGLVPAAYVRVLAAVRPAPPPPPPTTEATAKAAAAGGAVTESDESNGRMM